MLTSFGLKAYSRPVRLERSNCSGREKKKQDPIAGGGKKKKKCGSLNMNKTWLSRNCVGFQAFLS